jgi:adenosylcobinamide-GDP ribazoletransferase
MERIVAESRAAIGLLTRVPIGRATVDRPGAAAFGAIGALLAGVAAIPFVALVGGAREPVLGAIAAISVIALLSGAIHLDGLADTADALLARDGAAAERARKDPAAGPGGVAAVVLTVAAEVAALASIATSGSALAGGWTIVAAGGMARVVPVLLPWLGGRASDPAGLGSWFTNQLGAPDIAIAGLTAIGLVVLLAVATAPTIALAAGVGAAVGLLASWALVARRGGLDGDSFGASVELTFVAILASVAVALG